MRMNDTTHEQPMSATEERMSPMLCACLAVLIACYMYAMGRVAARTPLWMDEILTIWAARLPSVQATYSALAHGSEFAPPAFPVLLHYWSKLAGGGHLAMRLPSLMGAVASAICVFYLLRRSLGVPRAVVGACLTLEGLSFYALQARPYTLETACFAAAVLLWDSYNRRPAWWRSAAMAVLLALATSLHFYAVLFVPCLGITELLYALKVRKVRPAVWLALLAAGASIAVWLPLIHAMSRFNAADSRSPAYYAKASAGRLFELYSHVLLFGPWASMLLVLPMLMAGIGIFLQRDRVTTERPGWPEQAGYWAFVFGTVALPGVVFVFAKLVTHTLNERYAITAVAGTSALLAGSVRITPFFRRALPSFVLLAAAITLGHLGEKTLPQPTIGNLPGNDPIVIVDGLSFFPLEETSPPEVRSRLVYLSVPPGTPVSDPTNQHQIERWHTINPELRVENIDDFLRSTPSFYVADWPGSDDTPLEYLLEHRPLEIVSRDKGMIFHSRPLNESSTMGPFAGGH